MSYQIKRECWNEKTYNGYTDNPYWRIDFNGLSFGLKDDGKLWSIGNLVITNQARVDIQKIIDECKLNIKMPTDWKYSEHYESWYILLDNRIITSWTKEFNDETVDVCEYAFDEDEEVEFVAEMKKIFGNEIVKAYPIYIFKTQQNEKN